jgi:hypothetical protein
LVRKRELAAIRSEAKVFGGQGVFVGPWWGDGSIAVDVNLPGILAKNGLGILPEGLDALRASKRVSVRYEI